MMSMVAVLFVVASWAAGAPSAELQAKATGRFALADSPSVYEPELDAAVELGMVSLPSIIRPLARLRLKPAVYATLCPEIELGLSGELLDVSCGGEQAPFSRRLDGSDGPIIDATGAYQVEITHGDDWVSMRFAGDKGGQINRYTFGLDGGMVLNGTIFSPYLPDDLSWTLRYRRVSGSQAPPAE
jgi:hypothetical protein